MRNELHKKDNNNIYLKEYAAKHEGHQHLPSSYKLLDTKVTVDETPFFFLFFFFQNHTNKKGNAQTINS